jgi:hypothetical protein
LKSNPLSKKIDNKTMSNLQRPIYLTNTAEPGFLKTETPIYLRWRTNHLKKPSERDRFYEMICSIFVA